MAIISALPSEAIVSDFAGVLDFYYWMGLPVVRSWPRKPSGKRTPAVMAGWPAFAYCSQEWNYVSQELRDAYQSMSTGTGMSNRDLYTQSVMTGLFVPEAPA